MSRVIYRGERDRESGRCRVLAADSQTGAERELTVMDRPGARFHSPTGYEWGYGGSGPAQLAQDLLREVLGHEPPPMYYQPFKWQVIARLPHEGWELSADVIRAWLEDATMELPEAPLA